jgi:methylphosphotriester-DNA--protein-cysteine methyltransferase
MILHNQLKTTTLARLLKSGHVGLAGNVRLKIYGLLSCKSGKRMKRENRVFFTDEREALKTGYRPCGHCLPDKYQKWKAEMAIKN